MWGTLALAESLGFPSVEKLMNEITDYEYRLWQAYLFIKTGTYQKVQEKKTAGKKLKESLKHLVRKRGKTR